MTVSGTHTGPAYWRSLDEFAQTPEFRRFVEAEFPSLAPELLQPATRRQFLKLMGASLALAGLAGCRWPRETIVPASRQPAGRIPGVPVQYATAFELDGVATGLLVTSYDGRPIKIEGNDKHPFSRGKTNAWMQASILDLYDPDRSRYPIGRNELGGRLNRTWDEFVAFAKPHFARLRAAGGSGLAVLSESSSSPSLMEMKVRFSQVFPQAQWFEYEPVSRDNELAGARLAFGRPYRTHLHLDKADVIISFDSDFLMTHPAAVKYAGDFAARRRADDGTMNRLYVLENRPTVTGSMADHRYAVRSSQIRRALEQVAAAGAEKLGRGADNPIPQPAGDLPLAPADANAIAADLVAYQGRCVVVVGPQQPPEAHAAAHVLNAWLGAPGQTMTFTGEPDADHPSHVESIAKLTEQMSAGKVSTLAILSSNPVYSAPADLHFGSVLEKVATSIHLSVCDDETSQRCTWHLPRAHYLEAWGDARAWDGTLSIVQPLIEPLYGGHTPLELLALLCDDKLTSGYDIVRRTFGNAFDYGVDRATLWDNALHDGIVADTAWPPETPTLSVTRIPEFTGGATEELVFVPDYSVHDGRFANNAWLQEWPDPITKLTWDNAALMSPAQARRLGVGTGDAIRIATAATFARQEHLAPVYVLPGHADGSITLPLGYGRNRAVGAVGADVGFSAYALRSAAEPDVALTFKLSKTGRKHALVTTQDHHAIDSQVGRAETQRRIGVLVREGTLAEYQHEPDFAQHVVHLPQLKSLWQEKDYPDHKWGLAIDLSACIGCSACVVACQAENNIPVVGKDEVALGREMHWIRIDRYFKGDPHAAPANVEIVHQPVTCTHCENAPCEQVCPVAATVHDEEGLNAMVYNRCIGTRYCSNNCPFKVRRFNWFYNHHGPHHPRSVHGDATALPGKLKQQDLTEIEQLLNNPAVTVRSRGVMEKCTFCVQRIMAAKIKARNERWDSIPDGLITPACAQACPTDAIVFGDLNDPNSRVHKLHAHNRAYEMLAELNIKARTRYLAKLRNPAETKT